MKKILLIIMCLIGFTACQTDESNWTKHYKETNIQTQEFILKEKHPITIKGQEGVYGWSYTLISFDNKILVVNNTNMLLPNYIK